MYCTEVLYYTFTILLDKIITLKYNYYTKIACYKTLLELRYIEAVKAKPHYESIPNLMRWH